MLSDPLSVTYNSVAKSLPRGAGSFPGPSRISNHSMYATTDREFELQIQQSILRNGFRSEILLARNDVDAASNPYPGMGLTVNRFGLVYEVNTLHLETNTDIPLLRTALLALVDSTLQGRLLGGEL